MKLTEDLEQALQAIGAKTRITIVLYLGLLLVCMMSKKFLLIKDLMADLKSIFTNNIEAEQESQLVALLMQQLKTKIQKLKYSLSNKAKNNVKQEDEFELKFNTDKPKTKEEEAADKMRSKVDQFFVIWTQYVVTHYL